MHDIALFETRPYNTERRLLLQETTKISSHVCQIVLNVLYGALLARSDVSWNMWTPTFHEYGRLHSTPLQGWVDGWMDGQE